MNDSWRTAYVLVPAEVVQEASRSQDGRIRLKLPQLTGFPASIAWSECAGGGHCHYVPGDHALATHLCVDVGDLLDRTSLPSAAVSRSDDAPIRALPQLLHELVLRVDDERRIERGKRMALHVVFVYVLSEMDKQPDSAGLQIDPNSTLEHRQNSTLEYVPPRPSSGQEQSPAASSTWWRRYRVPLLAVVILVAAGIIVGAVAETLVH